MIGTATARYDRASGVIHAHTITGAPVTWGLHTSTGRGRPGLVIGGPAAGTTELLGQILHAIPRSTPVERWAATTTYHPSYPIGSVDWIAASEQQAHGLFDAAVEILEWRLAHPHRYRLLVVAVDGTDLLLTTPHATSQLTRLVVEGPAVGVAPILAAHTAQITLSFGGSPALRAAACVGTVVNLSSDPLDLALLANHT